MAETLIAEAPSTTQATEVVTTPAELAAKGDKPKIFDTAPVKEPEGDWSERLTKKRNAKLAEKKTETPEATTTEAVAEAVTETPTATTEKTTEEVKPETKSEKKKFKKFWDKKEGQAPETATAPAEIKPEVKIPREIQERLDRAEALLNKPSVKMVLQAEEQGKDFNTYYDELKSKDPYKMPYADIYKAQLDEMGYSETEKARKMERFAEKDEDDQADLIAPFRKQLKEKFDKTLQDYTPKFEKQEEKSFIDEDAYAAVVKSYENKELYGIQVTPQMAKSTSEYYTKNSLIKFKDGKFDPDDLFRKTFLIANEELILNEVYEGGYNAGIEKIEQEVTQPLSTQIGSHTPQPRKATSETEKRVQALRGSLPTK